MTSKKTFIIFFIFNLCFMIGAVPQDASGESPPQKEDKHPEIMTVKVTLGNVRRGPGLAFPVMGKLKKGDEVKGISRKDKWHQIRFHENQEGWAHESLFFKTHKTDFAVKKLFKQIEEIRFRKVPEGGEMVLFRLNGFYPPKTFAIDEGRPRVVCDFFDTKLKADVGRLIEVKGQIIRNIRVGITTSPVHKVRVVSDLMTQEDFDFEIQPIFFDDENIYAITVKRLPKD